MTIALAVLLVACGSSVMVTVAVPRGAISKLLPTVIANVEACGLTDVGSIETPPIKSPVRPIFLITKLRCAVPVPIPTAGRTSARGADNFAPLGGGVMVAVGVAVAVAGTVAVAVAVAAPVAVAVAVAPLVAVVVAVAVLVAVAVFVAVAVAVFVAVAVWVAVAVCVAVGVAVGVGLKACVGAAS